MQYYQGVAIIKLGQTGQTNQAHQTRVRPKDKFICLLLFVFNKSLETNVS